MPEIKNQFTGGKMNKDLDERLIPKGEYRDAMNIQVSTSEGSSVGAVQNILGNTLGCTDYVSNPSINPIPSDSFTVGSIADEKDDSLYWLISGENYTADDMVYNNNWGSGVVTMKDLILKKGPNECEPVFVDIFAFSQPIADDAISNSTNSSTLSGVALSVLSQIEPGWTVTGVTNLGETSNTSTVVSLGGPENSFIDATFESTVVTSPTTVVTYVGPTQSPYGVADGIFIPMFPNLSSTGNNNGYSQQTSNTVYIKGFNGAPTTLVNDTIEILPYHSSPQTFTIVSASTVSIQYQGGIYLNVVKVTLSGNLTTFTGPVIDQPQQTYSNPIYSATIGGDTINALITSQETQGLNIATGELTIDISDFNVANININDFVYKDNTTYCVQAKNTQSNSITLKDCNTNITHDGWQVGGFSYGVPQPTGGSILIQNQLAIQFDTNLDLSDPNKTYTSLLYRGPRILNFNHDNYITGINIIDDMLFWTDGFTEPKKINIPRSIKGSDPLGSASFIGPNNGVKGFEHTRLVNEFQNISIWDKVMVREEHITVIKKAPLSAPSVKFTTSSREGLVSGFDVGFTGDFNSKILGQTITVDANNSFYGFVAGDIIRLSEDLGNFPNYDLRVQVVEINTQDYTVEILSISPDADVVNNTSWYGEQEPIGSFLFERKLPRFAYRYKYLDNEYSSFSPFTNVAFFPGQFNYEPIKAYNKGMTNIIRSLAITGFITPDMPKDVESIDLLYKNETSPIIYLVDTVSNKDELIDGVNSWDSEDGIGSYNITNENIAQALPSNQSLRSWDNVPKSALAQEISGNRIIYGNYTQGYEIKNDSGKIITPDINLSVRSNIIDGGDNSAKKSIKSLRNYEVGVVWGDKYGRETPVITSKSGSVLVPKSLSKTSNHLKASLNSSPNWSDYYRFYVKETSNEYYNLAVDRVYDASDGNIWVSFPSVDRNKVDEDTYIILKKGTDSEDLVEQEGRYKVVAIENEAPDYIKTSYDLMARSNQDDTHSTHSCNFWGGSNDGDDALTSYLGDGCTAHPSNSNYVGAPINPPIFGRKSFSISSNKWSGPYNTSSNYMGLANLISLFKEVTSNAETINNEMYVSFTKETDLLNSSETTIVSGDKYRVIDVHYSEETDESSPYIIHLEKPIGINDDFVVQDSGGSTNGIALQADGIHVIFWQKSVTNKPEFDGRFFVKILNDQAAEQHLSRAPQTFNSWRSTDLDIYKIQDSALTDTPNNDYNWNNNSVANTPASPFDFTDSNYGSLNELTEWQAALKFGTSTLKAAWFIDNAPFAGEFISGDTYKTEFNNGAGNYDSCDLVSTVPAFKYAQSSFGSAPVSYNAMSSFLNGSFVSGTAVPAILDVGTGSSLGRVGMKGVHTKNGENYIDLSYSILDPEIPLADGGLAWDVGNPNTNTSTDGQQGVVEKLVHGTRFKLKGGQAIFKILSVKKYRLLNYIGAPSILLGGNQVETPYTTTYGAMQVSGSYSLVDHTAQMFYMQKRENKRATYRIKYELDEVASPSGLLSSATLADEETNSGDIIVNGINNTTSGAIQFLEEFNYKGENKISPNPAIFETEPKEDVGLDLYYEASSSLPVFPLTNKNKHLFIPIGTTIVPPPNTSFPSGVFVVKWKDLTLVSEIIVELSTPISPAEYNMLYGDSGFVQFLRDDGTYVTATLTRDPNTVFAAQYELAIIPKNEFGLNWHNCWSFNNGVESNRIGDTFNKPYLSNGVTLSTTVKDSVGQENRKYGLIYSGIYNSNSGVNSLNQFIAAEKITKDINPTHGSIQKLYAGWGKSGSLIALCEDRTLNILANKDALYNADGDTNITSTNNVLGSATPYAGEFGISKNPESFASESYRIYFTDKVRGAVMRLSQDGLTPISDAGMKNWFRDNLKLSSKLIGSYDSRKSEYNLTLKGSAKTVSFKEDVRGWVSFKSFTPENAISCANEYYTFKNGLLWKHHDEIEDRNTFYKNYPSPGFTPSSINVILNEQPGTIKTFHTLNYEGSQSKIDSFTNYNTYIPGTNTVIENVYNNEYYNISNKLGWMVGHIQTDLEEGSLNEFIKKEGKWFNYIKGKTGTVVDPVNTSPNSTTGFGGFDNADFSFQGIGTIIAAPDISNVLGCTANGLDVNAAGNINDYFGDGVAAFNYNPLAMIDDGGCIQTIYGCTASDGGGYDPLANTDDFSCVYYGCDNIYAPNYDPYVGHPVTPVGTYIFLNDGSCTAPIYGCMWQGVDVHGNLIMLNHNPLANTPCNGSLVALGSPPCANPPWTSSIHPALTVNGNNCCCVEYIYGCMDSGADNFDSTANTQETSSIDPTNPCNTNIYGCSDATACNYYGTVLANQTLVDDFSCAYCNDPLANNYDGNTPDGDPYSCANNNACEACKDITNLQQVSGGGNQDTTIDVSWDETWSGNAPVDHYELRYSIDGGITYNYITPIYPNVSQGTVYHSISGLAASTPYTIEVKAVCSTGTSLLNPLHNTESGWGLILSVTTFETQVYGCTDANACNYYGSPQAGEVLQDDGTCEYSSCAGCTDPIATNTTYFVDGDGNTVIATSDDGSCLYINGCTDATAFNYDPAATYDDGSCVAVTVGCLDDSLNNSGSTYAATNYAGPNTKNITSYTPPTPMANTACNNGSFNNSCCQYIMPTLYANPITFPSNQGWGDSALLDGNGWRSTGLWSGPSRKIIAMWDVSLSPKIILTNVPGGARTLFAYENENGSGIGSTSAGDINSFGVPSILMHKTINSTALNHNTTNFNSYNGIDDLELIGFEKTVYSGKVFFGAHPEWYPPQSGTGAIQQAVKFEFWENHIASYIPLTATYNVTLGCNDPNAWGGYNGEIPFFDNSICFYGGTAQAISVVATPIVAHPYSFWQVYHNMQWEYVSNDGTTPDTYHIEARDTTGDGVMPPSTQPAMHTAAHTHFPSSPPHLQTMTIVTTHPTLNPSNVWMHYRIRTSKSVNGNVLYGVWVDHWNQIATI